MENSRIKFTILVSLIHKYKLNVWLCHEPSIIRVFNVHRHVYYHLPLGSDNHFCGVGLRGIREWNVSCIILRQGELFVSNETFLSWIPIPKNTRYLRRIKAKLRTLELAFGYNLELVNSLELKNYLHLHFVCRPQIAKLFQNALAYHVIPDIHRPCSKCSPKQVSTEAGVPYQPQTVLGARGTSKSSQEVFH